MWGILISKIIKIRTIPQLIANNMSGCFFSETRCRSEVEIWPFRAYAMHPAIIRPIGTVRSLWTWLYGADTTFHLTHF